MPTKIKQNNPAPPAPIMRRRKQKFTEEEKMIAVATMLRVDGTASIESMAFARQAINSNPSDRALAFWLTQYRDRVLAAHHDLVPIPKTDSAIVAETDQKIEEVLSTLQSKILNAMNQDSKIDAAALRDLAVTFGIINDKHQRLLGLSPEMTGAIKELAAVCAEKRIDPVQAVKDLTEDARRYVPPPAIPAHVDDAITLEEIP